MYTGGREDVGVETRPPYGRDGSTGEDWFREDEEDADWGEPDG